MGEADEVWTRPLTTAREGNSLTGEGRGFGKVGVLCGARGWVSGRRGFRFEGLSLHAVDVVKQVKGQSPPPASQS
jgi:hypothetical protein